MPKERDVSPPDSAPSAAAYGRDGYFANRTAGRGFIRDRRAPG